MSSSDASPHGSVQSTLNSTAEPDTVNPELLEGVINRAWVPSQKEDRAIESDASIQKVMIPIQSARRLVKQEETASTYFRDDQIVITTTTVSDIRLSSLNWTDELNIIRRFSPDFHIPTDYSVYEEMSPEKQQEEIKSCLEGTKWFDNHLTNHRTTVLVQAKGWKKCHFELARPVMNALNTDFCVFYATGYSPKKEDFLIDIRTLVSSINPDKVLVIGKQSLRVIPELPPQVVSVAGKRWMRMSGLKTGSHSSNSHAVWKNRVEEELGSGQAVLSSHGV